MGTVRTATMLSYLVCLLALHSSTVRADAPEDREPPLLLYLEADGTRIAIELDKPIDLAALSGKKRATLRAEPYRVFPYGGISFRYPSGYSFKAEQQPGASIWTLEGSDVVIIVQRYRGKPTIWGFATQSSITS